MDDDNVINRIMFAKLALNPNLGRCEVKVSDVGIGDWNGYSEGWDGPMYDSYRKEAWFAVCWEQMARCYESDEVFEMLVYRVRSYIGGWADSKSSRARDKHMAAANALRRHVEGLPVANL